MYGSICMGCELDDLISDGTLIESQQEYDAEKGTEDNEESGRCLVIEADEQDMVSDINLKQSMHR